ncbi:MAG TPA: aquaporin [Flavobacterium sp.]|nr:aquaporin [Flavobacterium sp.]
MKNYLSEAVGTFIFIFLTVGIDVIAPKGAGLLGIGASFGIAYAALYYSVSHISGCHLNPVISIGALIKKEYSKKNALCYMLSQLAGGFIAVNAIFLIIQGLPKPYDLAYYGFGHNGWGTGYVYEYNSISALLTEMIGSTILGLVYFTSKRQYRGATVGFALILLHWFGLYVTGASYNPVYSFSTAFIVGDYSQLWLFIAVPLIGGLLGATISNCFDSNSNGKIL